jgi:hypothetical protein
MAMKYKPNVCKIGTPNVHKNMYQHLPLKDPKHTQIWIIGLKINHLATLSGAEEQGDQMGRIFAQWVIVFFWRFLKIIF